MDYFSEFLKSRNLTEDYIKHKLFAFEFSYIKGTEEAADILYAHRDKCIVQVSDFDCDGLISGLIGMLSMRLFKFADYHMMPRIISDGYGLSEQYAASIIDAYPNVSLVLTSDVGINEVDFVRHLMNRGVKVLVTDHHVPGPNNVCGKASVVVNEMLDEDFLDKNTEVCGSYVLYQVFDCYANKYDASVIQDLYYIRNFVAISTLSDNMPVTSINHQLMADGLSVFNYLLPAPIPEGYSAECELCNNSWLNAVYERFIGFCAYIGGSYYNGFDTVFMNFSLIPIINSVKRMNLNVMDFYSMFLSDAIDEGKRYAMFDGMLAVNEERKKIVNEAAEALLETPGIIYQSNVSSGIVGVVAMKVAKSTGLPTIIISETPVMLNTGREAFVGSMRDVMGAGLYDVINSSGYGFCEGHRLACGVTIYADCLDECKKLVAEATSSRYLELDEQTDESPNYDVLIDYEKNVATIFDDSIEFLEKVREYEPYGRGFEAPVVVMSLNRHNIVMQGLSDNKHTKIKLTPNMCILVWNMSPAEVNEKFFDENGTGLFKGSFRMSYFRSEANVDFVASA